VGEKGLSIPGDTPPVAWRPENSAGRKKQSQKVIRQGGGRVSQVSIGREAVAGKILSAISKKEKQLSRRESPERDNSQ